LRLSQGKVKPLFATVATMLREARQQITTFADFPEADWVKAPGTDHDGRNKVPSWTHPGVS